MSRARSARSRRITAKSARPHTAHTARRPLRSGPESPVRSPQAMLATAKTAHPNARGRARRPSSLTRDPRGSRLVLPQPLGLVLGRALGDEPGGVERAILVFVGAFDHDLAAVREGVGHELVVDDAPRSHGAVQTKSLRLGRVIEARQLGYGHVLHAGLFYPGEDQVSHR